MKFKNLEEIIDFAIEKEKEAAAFYEQVSEEEVMSGTKELLKDFAQEERKHQALLENVKSENVKKSITEYKLEWIHDIKRSNYIVEMEYKKGMGYRDILILAMKREEKALNLYNEFLKQAETENSRKLFKILCQEEAKHKRTFETMYDDYMAELGD